MAFDAENGQNSVADGPEIDQSFLSATFCQIEPGKENQVVETLRSKGHKHLFKSLGQFDLVSLMETRNLESPFLYVAASHIISSRAIAGYKFTEKTTGFSALDLETWLDDYPLVGFTLLELDKWLYSRESGSGTSINASQKLTKHIINALPQTSQKNIAFFGGFGRSELYGLVRTNNLDEIWNFVELVRNLHFSDCFDESPAQDKDHPVFIRTRTLPLVSYNSLTEDSNSWQVNGLEGKTFASIRISCPSGFESDVSTFFSGENYQIDNILGGEDINISTRAEVETAEIISTLLNFRKKWIEDCGAPIKTQTIIHSPLAARKYRRPKMYKLDNFSFEIHIPQEIAEGYQGLANRSKSLMFKVVSLYRDRLNHILVQDMIPYMDYLQKQLNGLAVAIKEKNTHDTYAYESLLREALESAEIGLVQRSNSSFDLAHGESFLPLSFGDGIFSNLVSLEVLVNSIFSIWRTTRESTENEKDWNGFAVFSDSVGFKVRWGEVIYFPLAAATNPFSDEGNWLTLTHEISHAIFLRLRIPTALEASHKRIYQNYVRGKQELNDMVPSYRYFTDEVFELFAHWYDFTHFYDKDFKSFMRNIWRSWIILPVVNINMVEYFTRSYVIYMTKELDKVFHAYNNGSSEYNIFLDTTLKEHNELLCDIFPSFVSIVAEMELIKDNIKRLCQVYVPLIKKFNDVFEDKKFTQAINKPYEDLDKHVQAITRGQVVTNEIVNPYALTKRIAEKNNFRETEPRVSAALVLSLKNQQSFLVVQ